MDGSLAHSASSRAIPVSAAERGIRWKGGADQSRPPLPLSPSPSLLALLHTYSLSEEETIGLGGDGQLRQRKVVWLRIRSSVGFGAKDTRMLIRWIALGLVALLCLAQVIKGKQDK